MRAGAGFSAVELLITLFIAAAFIGTGVQLYNAVTGSSGAANARVRASNEAYEQLRKATASSLPCAPVASPAVTTTSLDGDSLRLLNPILTITVFAPYTCSSDVVNVRATVTYGPSHKREEVSHAIYASR